MEVGGEVVAENPRADLQEEVGAGGGPTDLLFLDHAPADDLVDGGFGGGAGDGLAAAVAFAVVGLTVRKLSPAAMGVW